MYICINKGILILSHAWGLGLMPIPHFFILNMVAKYDLLVVNTSGERKSLVEDFSSGVIEATMPTWKTKELPSNEWKDTEGEDVYVPKDGLHFGGADFEVKMCYKGEEGTWSDKEIELVSLLKGSFLGVYCSYANEGWGACYLQEISDVDVYSDENVGDVVEYKLKFHITKYERMIEDFYVYIVDENGNLLIDNSGNRIINDI